MLQAIDKGGREALSVVLANPCNPEPLNRLSDGYLKTPFPPFIADINPHPNTTVSTLIIPSTSPAQDVVQHQSP